MFILPYNQYIKENIFAHFAMGDKKGNQYFGGRVKDDEYVLHFFERMKIDFQNLNDFSKIKISRRLLKIEDFTYEFKNPRDTARIKYVIIHSISTKPKVRFENDERDVIEDFRISKSVALKITKYFVNLIIEKYPQLKDSDYLDEDNFKRIEQGHKPLLRTVFHITKDGKQKSYPLFDLKKEKDIKKFLQTYDYVWGKSKDNKGFWYYYNPNDYKFPDEIDPYGEEFDDEIIKQHIADHTYDELKTEQDKILNKLR